MFLIFVTPFKTIRISSRPLATSADVTYIGIRLVGGDVHRTIFCDILTTKRVLNYRNVIVLFQTVITCAVVAVILVGTPLKIKCPIVVLYLVLVVYLIQVVWVLAESGGY